MLKAKVSQVPNLASGKPISSRFMKRLGAKIQEETRIRTLRGAGVYDEKEKKHSKGYSEAPAIVPIDSPQLRKYYRSTLKGARSRRGMKKSDSKARFVRLPGGYKQFRKLHGRNVARVDHTYSGAMLNSLRVYATNRKIIITVPASQLPKAYFTDKRRPWFRMSRDQQKRAGDAVGREIAKFYQ